MQVDRVIATAGAEIGATGGNKYVERYNRLTNAGIPLSSAWCACFITWVMDEAGVPADSVKPFCSCSAEVRWFKEEKRWKGPKDTPVRGDIIFFDYDGIPDGDHVGIVEYVKDGRIHTIEGNTGNKCARRDYKIGSSEIHGFGSPVYADEAENIFSYKIFLDYMKRYEAELREKKVSGWAAESWARLCGENIFDGSMPRTPLTREQAAVIICRLNNLKI